MEKKRKGSFVCLRLPGRGKGVRDKDVNLYMLREELRWWEFGPSGIVTGAGGEGERKKDIGNFFSEERKMRFILAAHIDDLAKGWKRTYCMQGEGKKLLLSEVRGNKRGSKI